MTSFLESNGISLKMNNENAVSNRKFGITFTLFFFLVSIYSFFKNHRIEPVSLSLSILFLILTFKFTDKLTFLNKFWMKLGIILKMITSPIVLLIIFFFVIFPTGIMLRVFKVDILRLKLDSNKNSYWLSTESESNSMEKQF